MLADLTCLNTKGGLIARACVCVLCTVIPSDIDWGWLAERKSERAAVRAADANINGCKVKPSSGALVFESQF